MKITEKDFRSIADGRMYNRQMRKMLAWIVLTLAGIWLLSGVGLKALALIAALAGSVALFASMARYGRRLKQAAAEMHKQAKAEGVKVE